MIPHVGDSLEELSNLEHAGDGLAARFAFRHPVKPTLSRVDIDVLPLPRILKDAARRIFGWRTTNLA